MDTYKDQKIFADLIGQSEAIRWLKNFIIKVSPLESNVLVTGPSGSGKELVSNLIHLQSPRVRGPLVRLHCTALPEEIFEAELFGAAKGAIQGFDEDFPGRIELSHRGTIVFDEIGDIPSKVQARLIRFAEQKQIDKIGQMEKVTVDSRIIATTNRNPSDLIEEKKLREDLYHRLNVVSIHIPPLKDRLEDLPLLIEHFLKKIDFKLGKRITRVSNETLALLASYDWPGNVRELINVLERAVIFAEGYTLGETEMRMALQSSISGSRSEIQIVQPAMGPNRKSLKEVVQKVEKDCIVNALLKTNGVQAEAAEILGLSPKNLWKKIQKHSINVERLSNDLGFSFESIGPEDHQKEQFKLNS